MFDFGFWELVVVLVVALVVVGPERLPQLARTAGLWIGRMRRMVDSVRADIQRELAQEELKKTLAEDSGVQEIKEMLDETRNDLHKEVSSLTLSADRELIEEPREPDPSVPGTGEAEAAPPTAASGEPAADGASDVDQGPPETPPDSDDHRDGTHGGNR